MTPMTDLVKKHTQLEKLVRELNLLDTLLADPECSLDITFQRACGSPGISGGSLLVKRTDTLNKALEEIAATTYKKISGLREALHFLGVDPCVPRPLREANEFED